MKGSPMKPIKQGSPIDQTRRRWIDSRRWRGKTASERSEEGLEREVWLVFTAATLLLQLLRREAEWVRADLDWDGLLRLLAMRCTFKAFCCKYRIVLPKVLEINALTHHRRACFSMPSSPPTASLSLTHSHPHTHSPLARSLAEWIRQRSHLKAVSPVLLWAVRLNMFSNFLAIFFLLWRDNFCPLPIFSSKSSAFPY